MAASAQSHGNEIPKELRPVLISLGKGIGSVSVYGAAHPVVEQIVDQTFDELGTALKDRRSITIGTYNGMLTVDEDPVIAREVPIRTLEKRLNAMKVSCLSLNEGLTRIELKKLLTALCSPSDIQMKESLAQDGMDHIKMSDVKYVALREGETTTGKGGNEKSSDNAKSKSKRGSKRKRSGDSDTTEISSEKITQIVAFLKGEAAGDGAGNVKKLLSDPERLGQLIMEAAAIRQTNISAHDGESLADIVVGCLRRTYSGLRKESEFQSPQGKVNLNKAMMLLEKNVLDKIHAAIGAQHPEVDRRIFDAIREMEEEQKLNVLTAHYLDQRRKIQATEDKLVATIRAQGEENAGEQLTAAGIPQKDWKRLMIKAGMKSETGAGNGTGLGSGLDMGALAIVLEKLEGLMQIDSNDPEQIKTRANATRNGLNTYADHIESRIRELEGQIDMGNRHGMTVEDHADSLNREQLMKEVSNLTLSLLQPLTVVNASIESAIHHSGDGLQKDLLEMAHESGKRMQALTKRLMVLVGYPVLGK